MATTQDIIDQAIAAAGIDPDSLGAAGTNRRFEGWTPAQNQPDARIKNTGPWDDEGLEADRSIFDTQVAGSDLFVWGTNAGAQEWGKYSPEMQNNMETKMLNAGLLKEGRYNPGSNGMAQHEAFDVVLDWSEYYGVTPLNALRRIEASGYYKKLDSGGGGGGGGGGGAGPSTATTIPDYATISQNSKEMLRNQLGREMEDWEIKLVADEMQKQYRVANTQRMEATLAGSGEFEIVDPATVTQAFIEDQYDPEITRKQNIAENSANYGLSMDVLTRGAAMVE